MDKSVSGHSIFVVIVSYDPEGDNLRRLCATLVLAGAHVVVVDNTENPDVQLIDPHEKIELIQLGCNTGIAHAQNVGTDFALRNGAKTLVYFDQDTIVDDFYLERILGKENNKSGFLVRCPVIYDAETHFEYPSIRLNRWGCSKKVFASKSELPVPITIGISSGTAVSAKVFEKVGFFDERLFIDFVDTDWFLRCRYHSVAICVIPDARVYHRVGDKNKKNFFLHLHVHSSIRVYYQTRNSVALLFRSHAPILFSLREISHTLVHKIFQTFYADSKRSHLWHIARGVVDGLSGRLGPLGK